MERYVFSIIFFEYEAHCFMVGKLSLKASRFIGRSFAMFGLSFHGLLQHKRSKFLKGYAWCWFEVMV